MAGPMNQMGTLRHRRAEGALPGVAGRGQRGPGVRTSYSTHVLGASHRSPARGHLTTPSLPRSRHVAGPARIHWPVCPAGKHRVWSFLLGTGCPETSFKEVGKVLPITATPLGWAIPWASEDVRSGGEILGSEVRRTGSRALLCPEQLRGPQAGDRPSPALGLPIRAMGRITARTRWGVAGVRGPVGVLTPASLGLGFLLGDTGEQRGSS